MQIRTNFLYLLSMLLLSFGACNTETIQPDEEFVGSNFFPLETGNYRIYDVEVIEYIFSSDNDTLNYQLKEVVADSFDNLEGGISYVVERFIRDTPEEEWETDEVLSARKSGNQAIVTEGNTPIIKLVFPIGEGKAWNSNALNADQEEEFFMQNISQPFYTEDSVKYEPSLTVIQDQADDNILYDSLATEVYAEKIGLIFKESQYLTFCAEEGCIGLREIESGRKTKMNLIEYGNE